jgi:hypothetical protein
MSILTPHAEVIVWNYRQRVGIDNLPKKDRSTIDETFLLGAHITKISTSKSKSQPGASFEIGLAPTYNWISMLTPGSWCAILMSPNESLPSSPKNIGTASQSTLKMLGRIDSVRSTMSVDNEGSRNITYIVTGTDWTSVFNTNVYLDPIVLTSGVLSLSAIGQAQATVYAEWLNNIANSNKVLPSTTSNIKQLISFWGAGADSLVSNIKTNSPSIAGLTLNAGNQYEIPAEVRTYLGLESSSMSKSIKVVSGKLSSDDTYEDVNDAYAIIQPDSVMGTHSLWQLINDNCNNIVNEVIPELRWPENNKCELTLYKRSRPFLNRKPPNLPKEASKNASYFKHVKSHLIPVDQVMACNAGTNWRDSFNFIEIMPAIPIKELTGLDNAMKMEAQASDIEAFTRDGFRPFQVTSHYAIYPEGTNNKEEVLFTQMTQWKYLLKEWYFGTQNLLNGSISFIGQSNYIGVGDNIMVDSSTVSLTPMSSAQSGKTFLLCHVESISHDFIVDSEGSRNFYTSVQFVRGIIVNEKKEPVDPNTGIALDLSASSMPTDTERTPNVIFSGSR